MSLQSCGAGERTEIKELIMRTQKNHTLDHLSGSPTCTYLKSQYNMTL